MVAVAAILQSKVLVVDENSMMDGMPKTLEPRIPRWTRSKPWLPHAVWAGILVVPFVVWMLWLSQTELPPGQCSGIGWGCSLAGWDAVGIALLFVGIPLLLVLLVGHLIIGVAQWIRSRTDRASSRR